MKYNHYLRVFHPHLEELTPEMQTYVLGYANIMMAKLEWPKRNLLEVPQVEMEGLVDNDKLMIVNTNDVSNYTTIRFTSKVETKSVIIFAYVGKGIQTPFDENKQRELVEILQRCGCPIGPFAYFSKDEDEAKMKIKVSGAGCYLSETLKDQLEKIFQNHVRARFSIID